MAGDWIKVEKLTPDKPELRVVARLCGISRGDAFLAWFRLWSYFDDVTENGAIDGFTMEDADEVANVKGFAKALLSINWVIFEPHRCQVTNWERHNGRSAKARLLKNRRQARWREDDHVDGGPSTK